MHWPRVAMRSGLRNRKNHTNPTGRIVAEFNGALHAGAQIVGQKREPLVAMDVGKFD